MICCNPNDVQITSFSVLEDLSQLAIGLGNGAVLLFEGRCSVMQVWSNSTRMRELSNGQSSSYVNANLAALIQSSSSSFAYAGNMLRDRSPEQRVIQKEGPCITGEWTCTYVHTYMCTYVQTYMCAYIRTPAREHGSWSVR